MRHSEDMLLIMVECEALDLAAVLCNRVNGEQIPQQSRPIVDRITNAIDRWVKVCNGGELPTQYHFLKIRDKLTSLAGIGDISIPDYLIALDYVKGWIV